VVYAKSVQVAKAAMLREMAGITPSVLATHYHTHAVRPAWAKRMTPVAEIGNHKFYLARL
jgi:spore germination cell wall hydrolase CwlJ-like protein